MIRNVIGFGCSWIHGDEIVHPTADPASKEYRLYREKNCTLGQLGNILGAKKVENYGIAGGSLQSTQWEFSQWVQTKRTFPDTLVVIGLTEASRVSWWNGPNKNSSEFGGQYIHNHSIHPKHPWGQFSKFYYTNCDDQDLQNINYWNTVNFFYNYCKIRNIRLFMFNVFTPPLIMEEVVDSEWNARNYMHSVQHVNGDVLAPGKHPNEKGSQVLAERLHNMINSAKII